MRNLEGICVEEGTVISEGIKKLDEAGEKILLVNKNQKLTGVVTDGDVRRWILGGGTLEEDINKLMHRSPHVLKQQESEKAKRKMLDLHIEAIPIVDDNGRPIDIIFLRDIIEPEQKEYGKIDVPVVIMAGGKGTRLYPYTNVLPKPLIPIGDTTILERIVQSFLKNGCNTFWLTLNYKKNLIKAYLDEKEKTYQIHYIEEKDFYGTCGAIRLLKNKLTRTFFISNCDVLLDLDFSGLLKHHYEQQNEITVVTSLKNIQVPYGVIELENGGEIKKISEKPEYNFNINTGIYVAEPSIMNDIPPNKVYHMTDLLNKLLNEKRRVGAYPITEQCWQDMGEIKEMEKMIGNFQGR